MTESAHTQSGPTDPRLPPEGRAMRVATRTALGAGLLLTFLLLFGAPIRVLFLQSLEEETLSHTFLIPVISLALALSRRRELLDGARPSLAAGAPFLAASGLLLASATALPFRWGGQEALTLEVLAAVAFLMGGVALLLGPTALRRALFPLLFLLFMVPPPPVALQGAIWFLQHASAELTALLLPLGGVPFHREGPLLFHLPGLDIVVAEECSGIRSSIALIVTAALAAHLLLRRWWSRAFLALTVLPLVVLKNALRITTLTLLATGLDPSFVGDNTLHRRGGGVFFLVVLLAMGVVVLGLRRWERARGRDLKGGERSRP